MPLNLLKDSLFYIIYDYICFFISFLVIYFYNKIRFKNKQVLFCGLIIIIYYISLIIIINNNTFYSNFINNINPIINEFIINLIVRVVQILFILCFQGGYNLMLKKNLIKTAQQNLGKTVASTIKFVGESKLTDKLKAEVKNSK